MPVTAIWDGSVWQPIQGLQGPEGPAGTDGTDGADGATGAQGPQGIPGPSSVSSDAGNQSVLGSDQLIFTPDFASGTYLPLAGGQMANLAVLDMNSGRIDNAFQVQTDRFTDRGSGQTINITAGAVFSVIIGSTTFMTIGFAAPQGVDMHAPVDLFNNALSRPLDPTTGNQVGDRDYNDARYLNLSGNTMAGTINMNNNRITNLPNPSANGDATSRAYVNNGDLANVSKTGDSMSGILTIARINGSGVGSAGGLLVVGGDLDITSSPGTTTGPNMFWQAVDGRVYHNTSLAIHKANVVPLTAADAETFITAFNGVEYDSLLDPRSNVGFIAEDAALADPRINSVRDLSEPLAGIQNMVLTAYHHTALQDLYARVAALEP